MSVIGILVVPCYRSSLIQDGALLESSLSISLNDCQVPVVLECVKCVCVGVKKLETLLLKGVNVLLSTQLASSK